MKLSSIYIKNFRSIKEAKIEFTHNCIVLIGKNEAGKSNILKAIATLFGQYKAQAKDKRKKIDNERIEEDDCYIKANLTLENEDLISLIKKCHEKFENFSLVSVRGNPSLEAVIENVCKNISIRCFFLKSTDPMEYTMYVDHQNSIKTTKPLFLSGNSIVIEDTGTPFDLLKEIITILKEMYKKQQIRCNYWQYSNDYLLPNSVNIREFMSNPSKYKALENIFTLAGRENIKKEFDDAYASDGDYHNLLSQVASRVTSTFQQIWIDFKGTQIELIADGDEVKVKVTDKVKYNCEDRSDGFKKFISILLMISTRSRAQKLLDNDLILIDEPDQSLYPTSAEYLKNELLLIAQRSKVIYTTHSQYMLDVSNLDRHIIVEKINDISSLRYETKDAPYSTDELLRRAIGTTIFECLKPVNLIFEGWLDKELFKRYCSFNQKSELFEKHGAVYLSGISGVETLVQILVLANKKFLIIADSDKTSNNKKSDFIDKYKEFEDRWLGYGDVCSRISTMEDFINQEYIQEIIRNDGHTEFDYDSSKSTIENIDKVANQDKTVKQRIKNKIIETLSNENILTDYEYYFTEVLRRLERM